MSRPLHAPRPSSELADAVFGDAGYSTALRLDDEELAQFRQAIEAQWLRRLADRHPELVDRFAEVGIVGYHRLADLVDHEQLWPKEQRLLPLSDVALVVELPFMDRLRHELGPFTISDVVYGDVIEAGRTEVYWRLVRPDEPSDVGEPHADQWFHRSFGNGKGMFPPDVVTLKVWLGIHCEPGRNGLAIVAGSHRRDWEWRDEGPPGVARPRLDHPLDPSQLTLVPTPPGTLLVFNERLLHTGVVNRGTTTRVSAEITLVFHGDT